MCCPGWPGWALVFAVLSRWSPCNARQALVGKARPGHRPGLLDLRPDLHALSAHLGDGAADHLAVPASRDGQQIADFYLHGHGPLSRLPLWAAGDRLSGGHRFRALLDPSRLSSRLPVEVPCGASCHPRIWNGSARRAFIPSIWRWAPRRWTSPRCCAASRPDIFSCMGPFNTITSCLVHANLNWTFRAAALCAGQPGLPSLASCRASRATRISPAPSRCGM